MTRLLIICLLIALIIYRMFTFIFWRSKNSIKKDILPFRDIPCNGDIFRAYWVARNYNLIDKREDFLGTIFLKWMCDGNIIVNRSDNALEGTKGCISITLVKTPHYLNECESSLYRYIYQASRDGVLEENEFKRWCKINRGKLLSWFDDIIFYETLELISLGKVSYKKRKKNKSRYLSYRSYEIDPSMIEEAEKIVGLKKFLENFSLINERDLMEVNLWNEYLMYAQMLGIADKVSDQFEKIYPEIFGRNGKMGNIYYDFLFVNSFGDGAIKSVIKGIFKNRCKVGVS